MVISNMPRGLVGHSKSPPASSAAGGAPTHASAAGGGEQSRKSVEGQIRRSSKQPIALYESLEPFRGPSGPFRFYAGRFEEGIRAVPERLKPHRHDYFELFWFCQGHGTHENDLRLFPIGPGSLIFIAPGEVHTWHDALQLSGYVAAFSLETFFCASEQTSLLTELPFYLYRPHSPVFEVPPAQRSELTMLFELLLREASLQSAGREVLLRSLLKVILIFARRALNSVTSETPARHRLASDFFELVEAHFTSALRLQDYARMLGVTSSHLQHTLRAATGATSLAVIEERRLLEARRLLRYTRLSIAEIAYRLGFKDPSHFARFYRRKTGGSPKIDRKSRSAGSDRIVTAAGQ